MHPVSFRITVLTAIGAMLAACTVTGVNPQSVAPATTGTAAPGAKQPSPIRRTVKLLLDPPPGTHVKLKTYWAYGKDAPFEIQQYDALGGKLDATSGAQELSLSAEVRLPQLGKLKKLRLLGADDAPDDEAEPTSSQTTDTASEAPDDDDSVDTDADGMGDDDSVDTDADGMDDDESEDADADGMDDEVEAYLPTDEDGGAPPADESGENLAPLDQEEDEDDDELPTAAEAEKVMSEPHKVSMVVVDKPFMSNDDDQIVITDEVTHQVLTVQYDQEWRHFEVKGDTGTVAFEFNPDGTYLVDGAPAANLRAAIEQMQENPVVETASRYSLAMLVARIGRLPEVSTRMGTNRCTAGPCGVDCSKDTQALRCPDGSIQTNGRIQRYRALGVDDGGVARAFLLGNVLLKDLLTDDE